MTATGYRALDMLIKQHPPQLKGRPPYWRPIPPAIYAQVRTPAWNWRRPVPTTIDKLAVLDANAAYLAAASSVDVGHGKLEGTGAIQFNRRRPGYWLINPPAWNDDQMFSPLGSAVLPEETWVTTPTMTLLTELQERGRLQLGPVLDSYTTDQQCRLRTWTDHVKTDRARAMIAHDVNAEEAIKQGYSSAVTMLAKDEGSKAFRPDWAQHIRAQHAATMWRRADALPGFRVEVYAARTIDELVISYDDARRLWSAEQHGKTPPVRIDQTRMALGTVKVKAVLTRGEAGWPE